MVSTDQGTFQVHCQEKVLAKYLKPELLIIDDMGIKQLPKRSGESDGCWPLTGKEANDDDSTSLAMAHLAPLWLCNCVDVRRSDAHPCTIRHPRRGGHLSVRRAADALQSPTALMSGLPASYKQMQLQRLQFMHCNACPCKSSSIFQQPPCRT